jgi:hypothetical protein
VYIKEMSFPRPGAPSHRGGHEGDARRLEHTQARGKPRVSRPASRTERGTGKVGETDRFVEANLGSDEGSRTQFVGEMTSGSSKVTWIPSGCP